MQDRKYIIGREDQRRRNRGAPQGRRERRAGSGYLELPHPTVSRLHAELIVLGGRLHLRDLGSRNGTFVVRGETLAPLREDYVELDTPLQFGERRCTLRELFEADPDAASPG